MCCHGQWKVNAIDKYGLHGSCGTKVCRLLTSIVGWQPCVEKLPQVTEQCFVGQNFRQWAWNCQEGNQSRLSPRSTYVISCAACSLHHHGEQACNHWWTTPDNKSLSCKNLCNDPQIFNDDESLYTLGSRGFHAQTKGEKGAELPWAVYSSQKPRGIVCHTVYWWWVLVSV